MTQKITEKTCALSMQIAFCIEKVRIVERPLAADMNFACIHTTSRNLAAIFLDLLLPK